MSDSLTTISLDTLDAVTGGINFQPYPDKKPRPQTLPNFPWRDDKSGPNTLPNRPWRDQPKPTPFGYGKL